MFGEGSAARCQDVESQDDKPPDCQPPGGGRRLFSGVSSRQWNDWRWQFKNRITRIDQLVRFLPLSSREKADLHSVMATYPMAVTPYYLSLIDPADTRDPIRIQSVPCFDEVALCGYGRPDPLEEKKDSVVPGLVHRYPDRCLMVLTNMCPMLCRHCTRKREWKHGTWVYNDAHIERMLGYIRASTAIRDVIISGGDVLSLSNARLEKVIARLRAIPHVEIIRIGTRCPVVLPQRFDTELCDMLGSYGPIWVNTHFNHPRELTPEAAGACDRLLRSGIPVNNQSVLLRGVNDTPEIQTALCRGLLRIKVRPYYLFQTDDVEGTEHLRTPIETGIEIMHALRGHTSGLAVPQFVVDLPGGGGKVPLQPDYTLCRSAEEYVFRNYEGQVVRCRNPGPPANARVPDGDAAQPVYAVLSLPRTEVLQ
jgi:lysine 2,3-aminomutase